MRDGLAYQKKQLFGKGFVDFKEKCGSIFLEFIHRNVCGTSPPSEMKDNISSHSLNFNHTRGVLSWHWSRQSILIAWFRRIAGAGDQDSGSIIVTLVFSILIRYHCGFRYTQYPCWIVADQNRSDHVFWLLHHSSQRLNISVPPSEM